MTRSTTVSRGTVLATARDLFAVQGYRGTSMKDIAEALEVRAPSLYNHVSSKQEILFAIMDSAMDRAQDALDAALAGVDDVSERLRRATESLVLDFLRFPNEVTICNVEVRSLDADTRPAIIAKRDRYGRGVREIIQAGCASGRFTTESAQLASYAILEMGNGAKAWFRSGGKFTEQDVATAYGRFALRVVGDTSAAGVSDGALDTAGALR